LINSKDKSTEEFLLAQRILSCNITSAEILFTGQLALPQLKSIHAILPSMMELSSKFKLILELIFQNTLFYLKRRFCLL